MTEFRTKIQFPEVHRKIGFDHSIMLFGSCFSDNIGKKLNQFKFDACINPFGVLYNPQSIANSIDLILEQKRFTASDLFLNNGLWNSYNHHSQFSGENQEEVLEKINQSMVIASEHLRKADFVLLTFGTAWVYELAKSGEVVSNCHKLPAKEFIRRRLSVEEIVSSVNAVMHKIQNINPKVHFVFTVSPIRHLKDGFVENQISKASLILAVNQLIEENDSASYFPAYEIMMDDLRDYRFYANDMLHPSSIAVDYIWNCFSEHWIDRNARVFFNTLDKVAKAFSHRPFNLDSLNHQKFLKKQIALVTEISKDYPMLDFTKELEFFRNSIITK